MNQASNTVARTWHTLSLIKVKTKKVVFTYSSGPQYRVLSFSPVVQCDRCALWPKCDVTAFTKYNWCAVWPLCKVTVVRCDHAPLVVYSLPLRGCLLCLVQLQVLGLLPKITTLTNYEGPRNDFTRPLAVRIMTEQHFRDVYEYMLYTVCILFTVCLKTNQDYISLTLAIM